MNVQQQPSPCQLGTALHAQLATAHPPPDLQQSGANQTHVSDTTSTDDQSSCNANKLVALQKPVENEDADPDSESGDQET